MLGRLRGMFAMAIWDSRLRELFLARDPYGIKPLYYSQTRDGFLFASQVKALLASGLVDGCREPAGLAGFYLWGSVPEPWTLYRDVFALPAGHWLRVRHGIAGTPVCWHDIRVHWRGSGAELPADDLGARVREALTDSVRAHLVSDVPVSVFLSGGIDSAVLTALASELGASLEGITVGFEEFAGAARRRGGSRLPPPRRTTGCRISSAACPLPSSRRTPHESWRPWISRRSTASTRGSPAKRRQSEGTRSSCLVLAATSCSAGTRRLRECPERPLLAAWPRCRPISRALFDRALSPTSASV